MGHAAVNAAYAGARDVATSIEGIVDESETIVDPEFRVSLDVYDGPFDVLLDMVAKRKLDLTEVSLSSITEEFLAYVRAMDVERNMDAASSFIDVASVLVEAKSATLLPADDDEERDEQSLDALRERDLLFARLLQYRTFKAAALDFRVRIEANAAAFAHPGFLDDAMSGTLPELVWTATADDLARIASRAIENEPVHEVAVSQLHVPLVDLREQAGVVRERLRALPHGASMTFAELTEDAHGRTEIVARFLAVLSFFKQGALQLRQDGPYAVLHVRWVPDADGDYDGTDFDEKGGA